MNLDDMGRELNPWLEVCKVNKAGDLKASLKIVEGISPRLFATDYTKIKRSLIEMQKDEEDPVEEVYPLKTFEVPEKVKEWVEGPKQKTLYISGGSGIGKTEMLKTLFKEKFGSEFIRVNDIEALKELETKVCKALMLDDIDLSKQPAEAVLGLFDVKNKHTQRVLYGSVTIPKGMARAVVSNKKLEDFSAELNLGLRQAEALLRRCINIDLGNKKLIVRLELELKEDKKE